MLETAHREYDVQNRDAIEYYKTLSEEELDRLIAVKEQQIRNRQKSKK